VIGVEAIVERSELLKITTKLLVVPGRSPVVADALLLARERLGKIAERLAALFHHHHEVGVRALDGIAQNSDELRVRKTAVDAFRRSRNVHGRVGSLTGRLGVIRAVEKRFVIV